MFSITVKMGGKLDIHKTAFYLKKENVDRKAPLNATESLQRDRTCRSVGKFR